MGIVLVFGDVDGQFSSLFQKLKKLLSKLKNVTMVLCAGNFFGPNCDEEWEKVKRGTLQAPTQIFILGPTSSELQHFYPDCFEMTDLVERITYLGKSGTFRTAEGLKIAYFSGVFSETESSEVTYSYQDIIKVAKDSLLERPDFLMTWSWPHDFGDLSETKHHNSKDLSSTYLFSCLAPQYHIAANERKPLEVAVERFYNDGSSAGVSRFIGLSYLGEDSGVKWIKALNVTPFQANNVTRSENLLNIASLSVSGIEKFFGNINRIASQGRDLISNKRSSDKYRKNPKVRSGSDHKLPGTDVQCWFCLANPEVEKHLIIAIGDCCFLALAKGPLVEDHVLISTIKHSPSMKMVAEEIRNEVEKFKNALREMFGTTHFPVFYERSFKSTHLQIHCVPVPTLKSFNVPAVFMKLADQYDLRLLEFKEKNLSYMTVLEDEQYFHVDLSHGHEMLIVGHSETKFPINFGREALTEHSLLNQPKMNDWRKCQLSKETEIKLVENLQKKFKKFDFT